MGTHPTFTVTTGPDRFHMWDTTVHHMRRDAVAKAFALPEGQPWVVIRIGQDSGPWQNDGERTVSMASDEATRAAWSARCASINASLAGKG